MLDSSNPNYWTEFLHFFLKNKMMLGEKLKKAISALEISPEEAATSLQVSRSTLFNLYKRDSINTDILRRACVLVGVPMSYWVDESEMPTNMQNGKQVPVDGSIRADMPYREQIRLLSSENAYLREVNMILLGKSNPIPNLAHRAALFFVLLGNLSGVGIG
jgi:hypothetical protein